MAAYRTSIPIIAGKEVGTTFTVLSYSADTCQATIYNRNADGTANTASQATVYTTENGGTTATQPLQASSAGIFTGWLDRGRYVARITATGGFSRDWPMDADVNNLDDTVSFTAAKMGVGTPAVSGRELSVGTGTSLAYYGATTDPRRVQVLDGSSGSPVTTAAPTLRASQYQLHTPTGGDNGGFFEKQSVLTAVVWGDAATKAQPTAIFGHARTAATATPGTNVNTDATAIAAVGGVYGAGATGTAIGVYGESNISNGGGALGGTHGGAGQGVEAQIRNDGGTDHSFSGSEFPWSRGIWCISSGSNRAGAGLVFAKYGSGLPGFETGIAFLGTGSSSTLGNPVSGTSIRDEGTAATSLLINGTHATAAIAIGASSGQFLCGLTTTATATKALIKSNADATRGLTIHPNSASASASILYVGSSSDAEYVSVSQAGNLRVLQQLQIEGTSGNGVIRLVEQTSQPAATTQDQRLNIYMKADKLVIQFDNAATVRYFTLDLTQTAAPIWASSTTGP